MPHLRAEERAATSARIFPAGACPMIAVTPRTWVMRHLVAALCLAWLAAGVASAQVRRPSRATRPPAIRPGRPLEYRDLAFDPAKWAAEGIETRMVPWAGSEVVLLTTTPDFDHEAMARFVGRLDAGWRLYADLVGRRPRPFKEVDGKPMIAAVPGAGLTCGQGCGYVGLTGIEVAGFDDADYRLVADHPRAFPHYYFYEMGRNYYLFGDRHSQFTTGYAVFMRYVCMDALGCVDPDLATRRAIEAAEAGFARSSLSFLRGFTMQGGLDEKAPRLAGVAGPSDQPVMYASAMLMLRRDLGGDAWLRRFFQALARCPEVRADTPQGALRQGLIWLVAASTAAGRDVSKVFVERWHLPMGKATRKALASVNWKRADPAAVLAGLPVSFEP